MTFTALRPSSVRYARLRHFDGDLEYDTILLAAALDE